MDRLLKNPAILAALGLLVVFAIWTFWPKPALVVNEATVLPPAKEVRTVEKIIVKPKIVYVYPKTVKDDLGLPKTITADDNKQVLTTGKLKAEERDYTLSAVLDVKTGEAEVYARPDPLPWIGPGRQGAVGAAYGLKNGQPVGRVYARQDLIQVKALHGGATGTVDTDSDWFAGGYVEWRF